MEQIWVGKRKFKYVIDSLLMKNLNSAATRLFLAVFLSALVLTASPAFAREWLVDQAGAGHFTAIQTAISDSRVKTGDVVLVNAGVYDENINFLGKNISLISTSGSTATQISGGLLDTVVTFANGEDERARLEGFSLVNGQAAYRGGAVYCDATSPTIMNCRMVQNYATYGAAVYARSIADPVFINCEFHANRATNQGGAVYADYWSHPTFYDCEFIGNSAGWSGGCGYGFQSTMSLRNCYIEGSSADRGGGFHVVDYAILNLTDCTMRRNHGASTGGAVLVDGYANANIQNSILWSNTSAAGKSLHLVDSTAVAATRYSCLEDGAGQGWFGVGCIDIDPFFVNGSYLCQIAAGQSADSPCVNSGDPTQVAPTGTTRTDRVVDDGVPDMGFHHALLPLYLAINNLVSGGTVSIQIFFGTPNGQAYLAYSLTGGGPMPTIFGDAMLTPPVSVIPLSLNSQGQTTLNQAVPVGLAGMPVWFHAVDVSRGMFSNPLALQIL